jgi:tetratricopeptide (TPR) repeat protein
VNIDPISKDQVMLSENTKTMHKNRRNRLGVIAAGVIIVFTACTCVCSHAWVAELCVKPSGQATGSKGGPDVSAKVHSFFEAGENYELRDQAMQRACASFDNYQKTNNLSGMLRSLSRIVKSCQSEGGLRTRSVIHERFVADVKLRINILLNLSSSRSDDQSWRAVVQSSALQTAIEKCVVVAEPRAARDLLVEWISCLGKIREQDPLLLINQQRMLSLALAYLARLDMESESFPESELEYRTAMEISQRIADRAFSNCRDFKRRLRENEIHGASQAGCQPASEVEDLDSLRTVLVPNTYLADKAYSEVGLARLYCRQGKLELAEHAYRQAVHLPAAFWCQMLSGLVTDLADRYQQRGDLEKAHEHFSKIQEFYGSHWSIPEPDLSYEHAVLGPYSDRSGLRRQMHTVHDQLSLC